MVNIRKLEAELWESADLLRAGSKLTSNQYCMPVLGLIFLRYAYSRFKMVETEILKDRPVRGGRVLPVEASDFASKSALFLPREAQYEYLVNLPAGIVSAGLVNQSGHIMNSLGEVVNNAMELVEAQSEQLTGVLPKDYTIFSDELLAELLRIFNNSALDEVGGDVIGRIYEYFLNKFAKNIAQDDGVFFTPKSLVKMIVNVLEPSGGILLDPACGSGGMFVQTGDFVNHAGMNANSTMTFYGQEKVEYNAQLCLMNMAVHGLAGVIKSGDEANTFYHDAHNLNGCCDYVLVWKTFLINQIITRASAGEYRVFNETSTDYKLIVSLLKCIYGESKTSSVVMPKIKKGSIELTAAFAENLSASLKLELEFDSQKKRINYTKLSKKVYQIFSQLEFVHSPVYVLIDELELSVRNKYQFEKDVALVRDLIIAIDDMNTLCSNKGMQIHTIAAIRSEVLRNVRSTGYELTKPIEDRGIEINWFQKGGDYKENQLLTIIENKIHASEQMSGFPPSKDVWKEYFGEDINGEETRKYILNNSLYRPRDIIRMMSAIHNQIGTSEKFTQEAFDKAQQEYSELMWTEIKDELRLSYSEDEVNAIFTLLNRITMPFTYEILSQRIAQLGKFYPRMPELLNSERLTQMLNKLYELGIIGNTGKPMNFVFLGRTALDLLGRMVIHTPLRNYFSVQYER